MVTGGSESGMKLAIVASLAVGGGVVERGEGAVIYGLPPCRRISELNLPSEGRWLVTSDGVRVAMC